MENFLDEIREIKKDLKQNGFSVKNNVCFKIENNLQFIIFFHKRLDGIYNCEMGIF